MKGDSSYVKQVKNHNGDFYHYILRNQFSLTPEIEKLYSSDLKLITDFLSNTDVPLWYRGISVFQTESVDSLFEAIRDDSDQGTAFRVRNSLVRLGLYPVPSDAHLKELMSLSRGNVLAFLWFLMELHYKTPRKTGYNVNEQLILSSIAHLDMVTTLRELDRILPPGNEALSAIQRRGLKAKAEYERAKKQPKVEKKNSMPYFNKLEDPVEYKTKGPIKRAPLKVDLTRYECYLDPNYQPQSEINRWFINYEVREGKRVAVTIVRELLNEICDLIDVSESSSSEGEISTSKSNEALKRVKELKNRTIICKKHEEEEKERKLQKIRQQFRFRQNVDIFEKEIKRRLDRIKFELQHDVEMYRRRYRDQVDDNEEMTHVQVLNPDNRFSQYLVPDSKFENPIKPLGEQNCNNRLRNTVKKEQIPHINQREIDRKENLKSALRKPSRLSTDGQGQAPNTYQNQVDAEENLNSSFPKAARLSAVSQGQTPPLNKRQLDENGNLKSAFQKPGRLSMERKNKLRLSFNKYLTALCPFLDCDMQQTECNTPNSSECYFERAKENKPLKFNYRKIFKFKNEDHTKLFIKNTCTTALSGDPHKVKKMEDFTPDLKLVAEKCADDIWKSMEAKWQAENPVKYEDPETSSPYPPGIPVLEHYDCEDVDLMKMMLKKGLKHMAKNPKFVLASLPESHKIPFLRHWVLQRYGKRFSSAEQRNLLEITRKIVAALERTPIRVAVPIKGKIGSSDSVNYACRDYVDRKSKLLRLEYKRRLKEALMEHTRIFWFALRPDITLPERQRETFFSYMPSRDPDLDMFRVWKLTDRRDAVTVWRQRQLEKSNAAK